MSGNGKVAYRFNTFRGYNTINCKIKTRRKHRYFNTEIILYNYNW